MLSCFTEKYTGDNLEEGFEKKNNKNKRNGYYKYFRRFIKK